MMLLGVGLLLPWNVCLNSLDYMGHNYPHFSLSYYITLAYVYPQLPMLLLMVKVRSPCASGLPLAACHRRSRLFRAF